MPPAPSTSPTLIEGSLPSAWKRTAPDCTSLIALAEKPERDRRAFDDDQPGTSLPDLERDGADRGVGIENRVPTEQLPAVAEVGEHVGFDRFAVQRMRVRNARMREPV